MTLPCLCNNFDNNLKYATLVAEYILESKGSVRFIAKGHN